MLGQTSLLNAPFRYLSRFFHFPFRVYLYISEIHDTSALTRFWNVVWDVFAIKACNCIDKINSLTKPYIVIGRGQAPQIWQGGLLYQYNSFCGSDLGMKVANIVKKNYKGTFVTPSSNIHVKLLLKPLLLISTFHRGNCQFFNTTIWKSGGSPCFDVVSTDHEIIHSYI